MHTSTPSRETSRSRTTVAIASAVCVLGLVLLLAAWRLSSGTPLLSTAPKAPQAFYTTDDGKTYFADDASHGFSYVHNGQPAVQAAVYTCDGGKTCFVGYLRRSTPGAPPAANTTDPTKPGYVSPILEQMIHGIQVKKPGEGEWLPIQSRVAAAIMRVSCPSSNGTPTAVQP